MNNYKIFSYKPTKRNHPIINVILINGLGNTLELYLDFRGRAFRCSLDSTEFLINHALGLFVYNWHINKLTLESNINV